MIKNIHMAAYCLDIEFWDQQQSSTNTEAYQALKRVKNKFKIYEDQEEHTEQDIVNIYALMLSKNVIRTENRETDMCTETVERSQLVNLDFWETILQSYSKIETCSCTILMRGTKLG
jgi:hypothetical protein